VLLDRTEIVALFPPQERDPQTQAVSRFFVISKMPQYYNKSLEELRLEDYAKMGKGVAASPLP
jgi:hypothetical protein